MTDIYIAIISIHPINPIILGVRYNDFFLFLKWESNTQSPRISNLNTGVKAIPIWV